MAKLKFSKRGIPIFSLKEKIKSLEYCIEHGADEDAVGHLFDLLNYVAPGYKLGKFKSVTALAKFYGRDPTPLDEPPFQGQGG